MRVGWLNAHKRKAPAAPGIPMTHRTRSPGRPDSFETSVPHREELTIGDVTVPQRHVVRATVPFNLTGHPALSVPFGSSRDGLPIGVQLVGRHFEERTILTLGAALESEHDARNRHPIP